MLQSSPRAAGPSVQGMYTLLGARRKSLGDGQSSSTPALGGFVPHAGVMVILPASAHVLRGRGVTEDQQGAPTASSTHPFPAGTLGSQAHPGQWVIDLSSANTFGTCCCKTGSQFPLESKSCAAESCPTSRAPPEHHKRSLKEEVSLWLSSRRAAGSTPSPSSTELPHTHSSAALSKSLLEVNIYIYCKWLIGNMGLRAPLG